MTDQFQTGDPVFSSGCSAFSKRIKEAAGSKRSHMSMIVRGEDIDIAPGVYLWEATGRGVGEVSWEHATAGSGQADFLTRVVNAGAGEVAIRRLVWPSEEAHRQAIDRFIAHRALMRGRPYEQNKAELLGAVFPALRPLIIDATHDNLLSLYCWECFAAAWMAMGLLPAHPPANHYHVKQFEGDDLRLGLGVEMLPIETLKFDRPVLSGVRE